MSKREWAYLRSDTDDDQRAAYIDGRLEELGLLNRRWPAAKGEHRRVAVGGAGGGSDLCGASPETAGGRQKRVQFGKTL